MEWVDPWKTAADKFGDPLHDSASTAGIVLSGKNCRRAGQARRHHFKL
jgi:hypothetical protein